MQCITIRRYPIVDQLVKALKKTKEKEKKIAIKTTMKKNYQQ